ncbi:hypothetical protein [Nocardia testacea]|uniref:hypothetical protein n=1 Tax=Nocardia testacea TaxID=248551 RepID=UPI0033F2DDC4
MSGDEWELLTGANSRHAGEGDDGENMALNQASTTTSSARKNRPTPISNAVMLIGAPVGLVVWTTPLWPDELSEKVGSAVVPVLLGLLILLGLIAVAVAVLAASRFEGWWRYQRPWAKAITRAGLDGIERGERVLPAIERIRRRGSADVVRVHMLTGQAPGEWARSLPVLAAVFGAPDARLRLVENHPLRVDLEFDRPGSTSEEKVLVR